MPMKTRQSKAHVKVIGDKELIATFKQMSAATQGHYLRSAVFGGLLPIQNEMVATVVKDEGNLARSIHSEIVAVGDHSCEGFTGTDVEYAMRIEFGFDGIDSLGRVYNQTPQPYARPAYDTKRQEAVNEVADILRVLVLQST